MDIATFRLSYLRYLQDMEIPHEETPDQKGVWVTKTGGQYLQIYERLYRDRHPVARSSVPMPHFNGDVNRFANGRSKWRQMEGDQEHDSCIPDMASKDMRNVWPGYRCIKDRNGNLIKEGPPPFRSKKEMDEYCKLAGFSVGDTQGAPPACTHPEWTAEGLGMTEADVPANFDAVDADGNL